MNLCHRPVNLRRPERAWHEGSTGYKRLDDTRCKTYKRRINYKSEAPTSHSVNASRFGFVRVSFAATNPIRTFLFPKFRSSLLVGQVERTIRAVATMHDPHADQSHRREAYEVSKSIVWLLLAQRNLLHKCFTETRMTQSCRDFRCPTAMNVRPARGPVPLEGGV